MSSNLKAHLALFSVALIYGANYSIAKVVLDDNYIQPIGFILLRNIVAIIFFVGFHSWYIKESVEKKDLPLLLLCGIFGIAINQMFFFSGLKYTTPINASLIMLMTPILVLITSAFILKEKITWQKVFGIALGILGAILLVAYGKQLSFTQNQLKGDLMILINSISYAIYLVIVKKLLHKYNPFTVVKWIFLFGIIFVFPFGIQDLLSVEWSSFSTSVWMALMYVLIFATIVTYFCNVYALKIVNSTVVSIYIYLQPLIATTIALSLAKDELTLIKVVAAILIFIGVYLVSKSPKKV